MGKIVVIACMSKKFRCAFFAQEKAKKANDLMSAIYWKRLHVTAIIDHNAVLIITAHGGSS